MVDPQAALCINQVGTYQACIKSRVPPSVSSKEHAVEMIELYAMELTRDVPFIDWGMDPQIEKVMEFLNKCCAFRCFNGPKNNGKIDRTVLFRGTGQGTQFGPYISQFLYCDIPYGSQLVEQRYLCAKDKELYTPNEDPTTLNGSPVDFGLTKSAMISIQNGCDDPEFNITNDRFHDEQKYLYKPRCLAEMVHNDALYQH